MRSLRQQLQALARSLQLRSFASAWAAAWLSPAALLSADGTDRMLRLLEEQLGPGVQGPWLEQMQQAVATAKACLHQAVISRSARSAERTELQLPIVNYVQLLALTPSELSASLQQLMPSCLPGCDRPQLQSLLLAHPGLLVSSQLRQRLAAARAVVTGLLAPTSQIGSSAVDAAEISGLLVAYADVVCQSDWDTSTNSSQLELVHSLLASAFGLGPLQALALAFHAASLLQHRAAPSASKASGLDDLPSSQPTDPIAQLTSFIPPVSEISAHVQLVGQFVSAPQGRVWLQELRQAQANEPTAAAEVRKAQDPA